jgi:hypothetical protein
LITIGFAVGVYSLWVAESKNEEISNRIVRDGLVLEIRADRARWTQGEVVTISAILRNMGYRQIIYYRATPCDPDFDITLRSRYGDVPLYERNFSKPVCIQVISERILEPGEVISRAVVWDQTIWALEPFKAPPGRYQVEAVFTIGAFGIPEPSSERLAVSIWIEIIPQPSCP